MMTERSDRVRLVVEDCVEYWRRTGVPRSTVADMREELERHLRDAVAEGKTVASVIGPDILAFAEEWAGEYRPMSRIQAPPSGLGPGLLALGAGILILFSLLGIGVYAGGGTTLESCCPRQVFDQGDTVISGAMLIWLLVVLAAGVFSIVGAVLMLRGRLRTGGWFAVAAIPLALLTIVHVIAAAMLAGAAAWAFVRAKRAEAPIPAA
jgi:hypothetical protein